MREATDTARAATPSRVADLLEITKPGIVTMAVLTSAGGYYLGQRVPLGAGHFLLSMAGCTLIAAGSCALNMYLERDLDGLMDRTRNRPLPAGRMNPSVGFLWGALLTLGGIAMLLGVNLAAAAAGALAIVSYVMVYTPLKLKTSLSTLIGAVPGALPPVIGWAASAGRIEYGALILFLIMFLWQLPHSLAIYYMYKEDYARAKMPLLPVLDPSGATTVRQALVWGGALAVSGLLPTLAGLAGVAYFAGAVILGGWFFARCMAWYKTPDRPHARKVFFGSLIYLTALIAILIVDKAVL